MQKMLYMCRKRFAYSNLGPTGFVDPVHMFTELWAMAISISVVLGHKQQCMNHFVKESLWKQKQHKKGQSRKD